MYLQWSSWRAKQGIFGSQPLLDCMNCATLFSSFTYFLGSLVRLFTLRHLSGRQAGS